MRPVALLLAALGVSLASAPARADTQPFVPWAKTTAPATVKTVPTEETDHDEVRLRLGLGYFGRFDVPLGRTGESTAGAQMIGMRVWFRRMIGFDLALGLHTRLGTDSAGASSLAAAVRASLPVALVITKHLTLFVAPTVGYGQGGETEPGRTQYNPVTGLEWTPPETRRRGLRASVGGRIGGELHLGFIATSRLSLTGSIGLDLDYLRGTTSAAPTPTSRDPAPQAAESKASAFGTKVLGNIAIIGYF